MRMMAWLHGYCTEHRIRYYLIGGSMLGAVRHRGFIPWDDDLDVAMPREDYERFIAGMKGVRAHDYVVETARDGRPDFVYAYAKVYDVTTTVVDSRRVPIRRGLFIDVFPLDGAGDTRRSARMTYRRVTLLKHVLSVLTCAYNPCRSRARNCALVFGAVLRPFLKPRAVLRAIDRACRRHRLCDSAYAGYIVGCRNAKGVVPKAYFGEPALYPFEGAELLGVREPDLYLASLFGDYMRLPPEALRRSNHVFSYVNLEEPYAAGP